MSSPENSPKSLSVDRLNAPTSPSPTDSGFVEVQYQEPDVEAPTFDDVYNDEEGDFILVSSDGISFRIRKYRLLASNTVFCDMAESNLDSENKIIFTDAFLESSYTIRLYLDFLHDRIPEVSRKILGDFRNLIEFAEKYECTQLLLALKGYSWSFLNAREVSPQHIFIIAAQLDQVQLAACAIRQTKNWQFASHKKPSSLRKVERWSSPSEDHGGTLGREEGGGVMQVACWSVDELERVPTPYWFALIKTEVLWELGPGADSYEDAANHFIDLMKGR